ncbi:MAG: hypothetical protein DHS20C15_34570 [Planctomycetota bacterium]|nr:MAG: hypothetical protein DHS20C15_34570 [Planctomycetota bacterium]
MTERRFEFFVEGADPSRTVLVDGTADGFRSLSHWPGNTTPAALKRDLSTGIALHWAQLSDAEHARLLGDFSVVANNHYDTDGVLSVFAVLHPERALAHRDLMLAAAAAGDFAVWRGEEAAAIDLTIMASSSSPDSPVPGVAAMSSDVERWAACYEHWLRELPALLSDPLQHRELIATELDRLHAQLELVRRGEDLQVQRFPDEDLALVTTRAALGPVALHEAVGDLHRVLVVHPGDDGPRYRFEYRDESWFELVDKRPLPLPRVKLDALRERLSTAECAARSAPSASDETAGRWWCEDLLRPVARLGFGRNEPPSGFFLDLGDELANDQASRLEPEFVLRELRAALRPRG